ncbi:TetR/AcrR family transcriptional regulator [Methylobacterium nonmethylotrophicum]|uniref:TetR/AcrR family transcriptional regulator n=1 Tax=Methylobacterium nonmethylotrophicum TaxID=1141884 RepID=A0A4Z0NH07_9HYPH|nr:TetR/AcrR family transcriptional regulator [Methylobacterium nonmethylotrophicum]TGD94943.1 TetR/AcrR family transcriptional regulator [Methylobacterium nonmethylotrophicum]
MADRREAILAAARTTAQAHGYAGLNFRDLGAAVGITSASIHYHFPSKAALGAAVARRYWQDSKARLDALWAGSEDPLACLAEYPGLFRRALEDGNRMCLCGFMAAEHDDLPDEVRAEVRAFADVQIAWLARVLLAAGAGQNPAAIEQKARAIFAAVGGAQVMARSRADISVYDDIIAGYRASGLLPAYPR